MSNAPQTANRGWLATGYLVLAVGLTLLGWRGVWRGAHHSVDFGLYYCSAVAWLEGSDPWAPENLYEIARERDVHSNMLDNAMAPPMTFALLSPYALLPYEAAKLAWLGTNLLAVAAILAGLLGAIHLRGSPKCPRAVWLVALVLLLAPIRTCIGFGQLAVLAVAALVLAYQVDRKQHPVLGGLLLALAGLLKPQLALVPLLYWLLRRRWKFLAACFVTGLAVAALAGLRLRLAGMDWLAAWSANLERTTTNHAGDFARVGGHIFVNLDFAIFQLLGSRGLAELLSFLIAGGLLAVAGIRLRSEIRRPPTRESGQDELLRLAFLATLGLLPIYHVYYDAAILALPIAWAIMTIPRSGRWLPGLILAASAGFFLPGAAAMSRLARAGLLPEAVADSWWFGHLAMAYQPWLILLITVLLTVAILRSRPESSSAPASAK